MISLDEPIVSDTLAVLQCFTAVLLLFMAIGIVDLGLWNRILFRFSALQRKISAKTEELKREQEALAKIPMMKEFAAYAKKKRIVDKLEEELKDLLKSRSQNKMTGAFVWNLGGRSVCLFLATHLAKQSADLVIATIPAQALTPFNALLAYPNSTQEETTPVSLFAFLIHLTMVSKIFHQRILAPKNNIKISDK
ncbi:unnamed protein product [Bursaphelenchus xylophilus]|uniref:(pine wood nematode) hypothetical protein n=1 Tax=Bursaphelenchus xylophilus TaxID=6326 RepID=A0A1I7RXZ2_BURXY|nr:unnamed protein product [Bursaphelenchus xylophilus]CAG9125264.1 unnamed protein product [Bursaphelenchus xylophilus]